MAARVAGDCDGGVGPAQCYRRCLSASAVVSDPYCSVYRQDLHLTSDYDDGANVEGPAGASANGKDRLIAGGEDPAVAARHLEFLGFGDRGEGDNDCILLLGKPLGGTGKLMGSLGGAYPSACCP